MQETVIDSSLPMEAVAAAKIIGCSKEHVRELARKGELKHYKVGRFMRFRMTDVVDYRDSLLEGGE